MSRSGSTGSSPGICNCCSPSDGLKSRRDFFFVYNCHKLILPRILFEMFLFQLVATISTQSSLGVFVFNRDLELCSTPVRNLRQSDQQDAICQFGGRIAHADRPTKGHDSCKASVIPL